MSLSFLDAEGRRLKMSRTRLLILVWLYTVYLQQTGLGVSASCPGRQQFPRLYSRPPEERYSSQRCHLHRKIPEANLHRCSKKYWLCLHELNFRITVVAVESIIIIYFTFIRFYPYYKVCPSSRL